MGIEIATLECLPHALPAELRGQASYSKVEGSIPALVRHTFKLARCEYRVRVKADSHSVQFSERAEFCDRFLLKCVLSCKTNFIILV